MLVGAFYFPTDYGIAIDELARELEARGFESLFVCEHTHIPVSRRTPFAGGGELPKRYSHTHDPFVALSFSAPALRSCPSAIPSSPPSQWRASTSCRVVASFSPSAEAGTSKKWRITAPATRRVSSCCVNVSWP